MRAAAVLLGVLLAALGAAGTAAAQVAPAPPVVLVPGLDEAAGPVDPATPDCTPAGDFAAICAALRARGLAVYVVPSVRGGAGAVLDNVGAVAPNAARLATYLRAQPVPALVVGHSMGGLIARQAVVGLGAPAAGLFTVGTPHAGSFGADLLVAGASARCRRADSVCGGLRRELRAELAGRGAPAVRDLTAAARRRANRPLGAPGRPRPPTWLLAGTWFAGADPTGYVFPNDLIVGRSSALAVGVPGLRGAQRISARLFHSIINPLTGGRATPNQFEAARVPAEIAAAAAALAAGTAPAPAAEAPGPPDPPERLVAGASGRLRSGTPVAGRDAAATFADGPFTLACRGRLARAVRVSAGAWALPNAVLPCRRAVLRVAAPRGILQLVPAAG